MRTMRVLTIALLATATIGLLCQAYQAGTVELPNKTGYCVSVNLGGKYFGRVMVPLHKPDAAKLEELRVSIANAYRLVALQQKDPEDAARLRDAADHIRFQGEPDAFAKRRLDGGGGGGVNCTCATFYDPSVVGHPGCGGACADCFLCS